MEEKSLLVKWRGDLLKADQLQFWCSKTTLIHF